MASDAGANAIPTSLMLRASKGAVCLNGSKWQEGGLLLKYSNLTAVFFHCTIPPYLTLFMGQEGCVRRMAALIASIHQIYVHLLQHW